MSQPKEIEFTDRQALAVAQCVYDLLCRGSFTPLPDQSFVAHEPAGYAILKMPSTSSCHVALLWADSQPTFLNITVKDLLGFSGVYSISQQHEWLDPVNEITYHQLSLLIVHQIIAQLRRFNKQTPELEASAKLVQDAFALTLALAQNPNYLRPRHSPELEPSPEGLG